MPAWLQLLNRAKGKSFGLNYEGKRVWQVGGSHGVAVRKSGSDKAMFLLPVSLLGDFREAWQWMRVVP
jgi:hypothetical protein